MRFKIGDKVHPMNKLHPWEDICCKILKINGDVLLVGDKLNGDVQWFNENELEHLSDFVMRYSIDRMINKPEECFWGIKNNEKNK